MTARKPIVLIAGVKTELPSADWIEGLKIGLDVQAWDADLDAVAALASTGFVARTAAATYALRTITAPAAGISIANGDGVSGNPTLSLANDLGALEGLASTGFAVRTAADTWAQRTLTAPAAGFTITNPAGVAGDPTFVLANDLAALEALSGTDTIYYRSGVSTWSAVTIGTGLTFSGGTLSASGAGAGTVTSVDMTVPSFLSVSGNPVTTSGTLAVTLATQSANLVFAGPTTGAAATPTFRSLVAADFSANLLALSKIAQGTALSVLGVTGNATANYADIVAASDFQVLRRSGTAVGFGSVNLASGNAVTGTLPFGNGGTGQTTYTNGQLLIGNTGTGGLDKGTLTAGTGISITNAAGAITVTNVGAGAVGAEVLISEATPSGTGVVTFSSIATTWRSLRVTGMGRSSAAVTSAIVQMTFNNDTSAIYDNERDYGTGNSAAAAGALANTFVYAGDMPGTSAQANYPGAFSTYIPDYAGTTFYKTALGQSSVVNNSPLIVGSLFVFLHTDWWRSTAAINRIDITLSSGNWVAGSRISLYGVY